MVAAHMPGTSSRRIAISGHRGLSGPTTALVDKGIRAALAAEPPGFTGISCLANGADQIFACAIADLGGSLEAIVPARTYRDKLPAEAQPRYDSLLAAAATVHRLPFIESNSQSYWSASTLMIDTADELYAVWDGKPARGRGGTADVVAYARERDIPVHVIWPLGACRD